MTNETCLNLSQALILDGVIGKYLDTVSIKMRVVDLGVYLLSRMRDNPKEYLKCLSLFSRVPEDEVDIRNSAGALNIFIQGLAKNNVIEMHSRFKNLGLK